MSPTLPGHATILSDLEPAWRVAPAGARVEALRSAARELKERLRGAGKARSVRTWPLVTFPYPTRFAFAGAARSSAPYVMMTNRMQLVTFDTDEGTKRLLVNPSDWERDERTPFFRSLMPRYGAGIVRRLIGKFHGDVPSLLAQAGVPGEAIDYVTFDHLHTQDCRRLLLEWAPRARLLVARDELAIFERLHPLQRFWYLPDALDGVPRDRVVPFDRDLQLGPGVALVRTPGHTLGNHSIVLHTDRGLWTISENGVACDSYAPTASRIAGLAAHARSADVEVILNANTRESSLDQYASMIVEATIADPVREAPQWPQHFASSELTRSLLAPGLEPTWTHGAITHGAEPAALLASPAASSVRASR